MSDCCDIFRFTDPGDGFSVGEGKVHIDVDSQLSGTSENPVQNKVIYNALQNFHIDVDDELSATSENPVQNKVITQELADQKSAIEDLQALTDRKAGALIDTASGAIASFFPDSTIDNLLGLTVAIEPMQAGSGDPSPDNICPISGWTGANVYRTGVNLLDISAAEVGTAWNGAANTARARLVIPIKRNTQYILTMNGTNSLDGVLSALSTTVPPSGIGGRTFPYSFNSGENDYLVLGFNKDAISQSDLEALNLQLELGSTASTYHSYAGNRYTIQLGQTVYGGTLDVTAGTLTVDRAMVALSTASGINRNSAKQYYISQSATPGITKPSAIEASVLSNQFKPSTSTRTDGIVFLNTTGSIRFNTTAEYASSAEMIAALGTLEFCYPLSTPITITLDPVTISTISGQTNNVWADAGDVSVEFAADLKHYIDSKIAAAVAALS